jgi:uncharacterized membrane protein YjjP (DUF1212 family)
LSDDRIPFILSLASALHEAGHSTYQIEDALEATGNRLGLRGQYFVTPTSIFASFGVVPDQRTFMQRTAPRSPDLGRLVRVTEIARAVLRGDQTPEEGSRRLAAVAHRPAPGPVSLIVAHGLASGAAARFLGGGWPEIGMAAAAGIGIGLLALASANLPNVRRIHELAAAFSCSFALSVGGVWIGGYSVSIATLAGLIVLIPGLMVTTAIGELATSHLTAGSTRLAGAFMTFIAMGFGVALGSNLAEQLIGAAPVVTPSAIAPLANWLALGGSAAAFSILLRADRRDLPWIALAGVTAFMATRAGSLALGPELGVFIGALVVGLGSNVFNRITDRPAAVALVPGLLTLVPGSIGFRSITALLDSEVVTGVGTAFTMILTAVSLVAGLLLAAAIYPEKPLAE